MPFCRMRTILAAMMMAMATIVVSAGNVETERAAHRAWLSQQVKSWASMPDKHGQWPADGSPWAPMDLARVFGESDLVIECRVRPHLNEGEGNKLEYHPLLVQVEQIAAVHKGSIATGAEDWTQKRQLSLSVVVDDPHSGHWGYVALRSKQPYLLLLQDVDAKTRKQLGLADLPGRLLRTTRVWQGAIALSEGNLPGQAGAYCTTRSRPYTALRSHLRDLRTAIAEMGSLVRTKASNGRVSALRNYAEFHTKLLAAAEGDPRRATEMLKDIPKQVAELCEAVAVLRGLLEEKAPELRKKHLAHLKLLTALAGDIAEVAAKNRARAATTEGR